MPACHSVMYASCSLMLLCSLAADLDTRHAAMHGTDQGQGRWFALDFALYTLVCAVDLQGCVWPHVALENISVCQASDLLLGGNVTPFVRGQPCCHRNHGTSCHRKAMQSKYPSL